jgi:Recombinase zinc beta ribbon domain
MRCALCGARITIQTSQRKKNGTVYRYGRYRCSFHVTKGPAVCSNGMSIQQPVLDAKLLAKFQAALSPDMIDYLVGDQREAAAAPRHDAAGDPHPDPRAAGGRAPTIEPRRVRGEGRPVIAAAA